MAWDNAQAAVVIQRIARGRAARRELFRRKLHTVTGGTLLEMLEGVRLYHTNAARSARVASNLEQLPDLVPRLSKEYDLEKRTSAAKDVAVVLCEAQGENALRAFRLIKSSSVAHFTNMLAREQLEPPNTAVLYPLFAIMSNLPSLGGRPGEDLLKSSGCFELLVDCLFSKDGGVQYYAIAAVSNMSHDLEAVAIVKEKKATAQLEALLDSPNRHVINFALKALENVNEVHGAFDFLFGAKKREIAERRSKMEAARIKYRSLSDSHERRGLAALHVQKWARGRLSRRGMLDQVDSKAEMARAAVRIQAVARGKLTRTTTARVRQRTRALKMRAGVSRVSRVSVNLKKRVKRNHAAAVQAGGRQRIERVRALAEQLHRTDAARPVHVAMLLDATRAELDELERHARAPTPDCLAILADLRRRYALACAGGGPAGLARLERAQPIVAKLEASDGVAVHAAIMLFASAAELRELHDARGDATDASVRGVLGVLAARYAHARATVDLSATEYERVQALVAMLDALPSGSADGANANAHTLVLAAPTELQQLEAEAEGEEARRLLIDLRLRAELALVSAGTTRSALIAKLRARPGIRALTQAHLGVLVMATRQELRALEDAWPEGASAFGAQVDAILDELRARYAVALATFRAELGALGSPAGARRVARFSRPIMAQALFGKVEEVPHVLVHPGVLALCTAVEMEQLHTAREAGAREGLTRLIDARVRLELALAAPAGALRLQRTAALVVKYDDVPFVHAGLFLLASKPDLKQLYAEPPNAVAARGLLDTLRARHERAAAELIAAKRERQAQLAAQLERVAKTSALAASMHLTLQRKVERSTAVATHAQAVSRSNEARTLAAAKRERQQALSHAQRVLPAYTAALNALAGSAADKQHAATVVLQERERASNEHARQATLRGAATTMPAVRGAARALKTRAMSRTDAATTIQRYWRGCVSRRAVALRRAARGRIHALAGVAPTVHGAPVIFESALRRRHAAATTIQRFARGRAARLYAAKKMALLAEMGELGALYPALHHARSAVVWLSRRRHFAAIELQRIWRGARAHNRRAARTRARARAHARTRRDHRHAARAPPGARQASPRASACAGCSPRWARSTARGRSASTCCKWTRTCSAPSTRASAGVDGRAVTAVSLTAATRAQQRALLRWPRRLRGRADHRALVRPVVARAVAHRCQGRARLDCSPVGALSRPRATRQAARELVGPGLKLLLGHDELRVAQVATQQRLSAPRARRARCERADERR